MRKRILNLRRSQSWQEIKEKSQEIEKRLFNFSIFAKAQMILFYLALGDEVQTEGMVKKALGLGKRVAIPLLKGREILPSELKDYQEELRIGKWRILQPKRNFYRPLKVEEIDLVIVPGVAFDKRGGRIGFGGGFYDRFLRKLPPGAKSVSLAFELQLVEEIFSQPHDVAVDYIITEKQIIKCT